MDILYGDYKKSPTLIDQFYIFGYDPTNKDLLTKVVDFTRNDRDQIDTKMQDNEYPIVINQIASLRNKKLFDEIYLLRALFPSAPKIYTNVSNPEKLPNYHIAISARHETVFDNDTTIDQTYCVAYVFYEQYEQFWFPKIFCITSEFPFFSFFKQITHKIYCEFEKDEITIPLEIFILNLINCLPPPVNYPALLDLTPKINLTKSLTLSNKPSNAPINQNFLRNSEIRRATSKIIKYKFKIPPINKYCYIDYNINYLLQKIPVDIITKMIVLSYFNIFIIVFHKDLSILNNVLQMLCLLFPPFVEDPMYRFRYSFHKDEFENVLSFVIGNSIPCLFGINAEYSSDYSLDLFTGTPAICMVDLNQKKQDILLCGKDIQFQEIYKNIDNTIKQYENAILKKTSYEPNTPLGTMVINAYKQIQYLSLGVNGPGYQYKEPFCDNALNEELNFPLQDIAYSYSLDMFNYLFSQKCFKSNVSLVQEEDKILITSRKYQIINEDDNDIEKQRLTSYVTFKKDLLYSKTIKEKFAVDMICFQCFLQYKRNLPKNVDKNLNYMKVIKEVYNRLYTEHNTSETISFNTFNEFYERNLSKAFNNEMAKSPDTFQKIENPFIEDSDVHYQYKTKELNQSMMYKYLKYLKTLSINELAALFPSFKRYQNPIKPINYTLLTRIIDELIQDSYQKDQTSDIISVILKLSIFTIDNLYDKSPFFYILYYPNNYSSLFLYYHIMDMISVLYIIITNKVKNKNNELTKDFDTLYMILDYMVQKQIIPKHSIMKQLDELFMIDSKVRGDTVKSKVDPIEEQYQSIYNTKINVTIKGKTPKEAQTIIKNCALYNIDSSNALIQLVNPDKTIKAETTLETMSNLKKSTNEMLTSYILSGKPLLADQKDRVKNMVVNVIAYLSSNDKIKVDLLSFLDYLGN